MLPLSPPLPHGATYSVPSILKEDGKEGKELATHWRGRTFGTNEAFGQVTPRVAWRDVDWECGDAGGTCGVVEAQRWACWLDCWGHGPDCRLGITLLSGTGGGCPWALGLRGTLTREACLSCRDQWLGEVGSVTCRLAGHQSSKPLSPLLVGGGVGVDNNTYLTIRTQ